MSIDTDPGGARRGFPTTHASILEAAASVDEEVRRRGFGALVSVYWRPVYTYLRLRWGHDRKMAKDLTQDFFTEAMTRGFFESYDPARARFRTFVRSCVDHFAANARRAEGRLKRGGGAPVLSLDFDGAEAEFARTGSITEADAETRFRQEWMRALLSGAVDAFRAECARGGREDRFRLFERYDLEPADGNARPTYKELAGEFGLPAPQIMGIVIGSMGKGLVAGVLIGLIARKVNSLPIGVVSGLVIAALFALPFALGRDPATGKQYFWEIMIPGSMVGLIVGYATQKFGRPSTAQA